MIRTAPIQTALLVAAAGTAATANANIRITEYMYSATSGEYLELTNLGSTPVDMTGWVYDDSSAVFSPANATGADDALGNDQGLLLDAFGIVQPGESVIITESVDFIFRADWNLGASVKIISEIENNLGRGDTINIFDASGTIVDILEYDDRDTGGPRAQRVSANPATLADLGINNHANWVLSALGDDRGSYASLAIDPDDGADIGNPGFFQIPTPASATLLGLAGLAATRRRR